jgi:hypothetical protein
MGSRVEGCASSRTRFGVHRPGRGVEREVPLPSDEGLLSRSPSLSLSRTLSRSHSLSRSLSLSLSLSLALCLAAHLERRHRARSPRRELLLAPRDHHLRASSQGFANQFGNIENQTPTVDCLAEANLAGTLRGSFRPREKFQQELRRGVGVSWGTVSATSTARRNCLENSSTRLQHTYRYRERSAPRHSDAVAERCGENPLLCATKSGGTSSLVFKQKLQYKSTVHLRLNTFNKEPNLSRSEHESVWLRWGVDRGGSGLSWQQGRHAPLLDLPHSGFRV